MNGIDVRPMRWPDVPAVFAIEVAVFPDTAWSTESFWAELAGVPETRRYLVAVAGEVVLGYGGLMVVGRQADVQTIAVGRDHQGCGVGALLLDALLGEARRRDCSSVLLEVRADNAPAVSLYRARGFKTISRRRDYYGDGRDAMVMRLRLGTAEAVS